MLGKGKSVTYSKYFELGMKVSVNKATVFGISVSATEHESF